MDVMWLWGALGLALLAAEMATGTIYLLWFGISALCMAILVWIYPNIHYGIQFALFAGLSVTALALWKLNYKKPKPTLVSAKHKVKRLAELAP